MRRARRSFAVLALCAATWGCGDDEAHQASHGGGGMGEGGAAGHGPGGGGGAAGMGGAGGCVPSLPIDEVVPELLSQTGLYSDIAGKQLFSEVRTFAPQFELWSDGANKQRWLYLPDCPSLDTIDTSDMDDWSLPPGARMWKEFSVGGARIETRLIARVGPGVHDFVFAAYLWDDAEAEAQRVPDGQPDAKGTTHDVPSEEACRRCHGSHEKGGGRPSRALGISAIQLSHAGPGVTLASLIAEGRLSDPPAGDFVVPGDATERAALGYLHANCGHCHNDTADRVPQVDLKLWLRVAETSVAGTSTYLSAVGQPNAIFNDQNVTARIEPGNAAASAVWFRMNARGNNAQMPPMASEIVDAAGLTAVETWIEALP